MTASLAWGIIGTGHIARAFARGLAGSQTGTLVAMGSRSVESAEKFGAEFGVTRCHGSYEALLADPQVQAVYISTPHLFHAEWSVKAAEAGKHILCEKPIAMTAVEAERIIDAARQHDVFLMEAFMYRCHPQTLRMLELIREGAIGEVRVIQATFSFHSALNLDSRLLNPALGGGGILDVGGYCGSMSRLIAGVAQGKPFAEPLEFHATGFIGEQTTVDEYTVAIARFPGEIVAQMSCGVQVTQENVLRVYGSSGRLLVPSPWVCNRNGGPARIILTREGGTPEEILLNEGNNLYGIEADNVAAHLAARQSPAMSWEDTLGNMRLLDRWRAAIGLTYPGERGCKVG